MNLPKSLLPKGKLCYTEKSSCGLKEMLLYKTKTTPPHTYIFLKFEARVIAWHRGCAH